MDDSYALDWEDVPVQDFARKRVGKLKESGIVVVEIFYDRRGRRVEKRRNDERGTLVERVVYERDDERRPLRTKVYDKEGNLKVCLERGTRPSQGAFD